MHRFLSRSATEFGDCPKNSPRMGGLSPNFVVAAVKNLFMIRARQASVAVLLMSPLLAQEADPPSVQAVQVEQEPVLDGVLDEPVWQEASPVGQFRQRNPQEGNPATERTEVRILYSETAIFFGVTCYDSQPDRIIATQRARDADLEFDDSFTILLDTFHSHRNAFWFEMNPLGARFDSWITDEGGRTSPEWDERWEVAVAIGEEGWVAEVRIPFSVLRTPAAEEQVWGIDFRRNIKRKNEEVAWSNYRRDFTFEQVSQAGHLVGLRQIPRGFTYRIKPYVLLGLSRSLPEFGGASTHNESDVGLEVFKYRLSPNLTLDLTVNPDFAETEVDDPQINVTRFPLFFPEKREFFLEDAGVFELGPGGDVPELRLFHSRRIGLTEDGEAVPILFGGRLTGKAGKFELGLLNAQTLESDPDPRRNYTVGRVKRIFGRSFVGAMVTNLQSGGSSDYNRTAALDSELVFFDHLSVNSFLVHSWSPDLSEDTWAFRPAKITWESDFLNANIEHQAIQRNFEAEMGFVPRKDMKQTLGEISIHPRPDSEWIRRTTLGAFMSYISNQAGELETRDQKMTFGVEWESGDRSMVDLGKNLESITQPFLLREKFLILPGVYRNNQYEYRFRTFRGRRLSTFLRIRWEEFWGGDRFSTTFNPNFIISDNLSVRIEYEFDDISLPQGQLTTHLVNSIFRYNFSNVWLTTTTLQFDSSEDLYNLNFRLNYIYRPGDDVFLVFNRTSDNERTDWSVLLKVTRSFDF